MVYQASQMSGENLETDYMMRMAGVGTSFQERQRERVRFPECVADLAKRLLAVHRQAQNGTIWGPQLEATLHSPYTPGYIGSPSLGWMGRCIVQWKDKWGRH